MITQLSMFPDFKPNKEIEIEPKQRRFKKPAAILDDFGPLFANKWYDSYSYSLADLGPKEWVRLHLDGEPLEPSQNEVDEWLLNQAR